MNVQLVNIEKIEDVLLHYGPLILFRICNIFLKVLWSGSEVQGWKNIIPGG